MTNHRKVPSAFTLLELLIVLALLSLLVVIVAAAVSQYITVGQTMATEATIRKVYAKLQTQWGAVLNQAIQESHSENTMNETLGPVVINPPSNPPLFFTDFVRQQMPGIDIRKIQTIYIKLRLMDEFPENYTETSTGPALGAVQFTNFKAAYRNVPAWIAGQRCESSVCLLTALRQARRGIQLSGDDLGTSVKTFISPTASNPPGPTDTAQVLVDGWGNPLYFSRWPTGNADVDALYPGVKGNIVRDPQDTDGTLMDNVWWTTYHGVFESWLHSIHQGTPPNVTPYAYYTMPVIASAGPNGLLGLNLPDMSLDGTGNDTDNIYSYRLLSPGSKGN